MTPAEWKQVSDMISAAVRTAVQPLRDDIDALKAVDKRHSGFHREIATNVRSSKSDVEAKVTDTATAIAMRDQQLVNALTGVEQRLTQRIEAVETPAKNAQSAAVQAKDATTTTAVDVVQTKADVRSSRLEGRLRTLAVLCGIVLATIIQHLLKGST